MVFCLRPHKGAYSIDFDDFEEKLSESKIFILCNPHNPVGRAWNEEELGAMSNLCAKHNVLIISDDVHSDIVYENASYMPIAHCTGKAKDHIITCTSPSKTFNLAGLNIANIIIHDEEKRKTFAHYMKMTGIPGPNPLSMAAMIGAYTKGETWYKSLVFYLQANRDYARKTLSNEIPGIEIWNPEATYLMWINFSQLGIPKEKLDKMLINDARVWLSEGSIYCKKHDMFKRLNFAVPRSSLERAIDGIVKTFS